MSYDLMLHPRADRPYSAEDLRVFLSAWHRGLYRITESGAFYENEHTGVSFSLDLDTRAALAVVRIPLARPHPFGIEAAREVDGLCRALGLTVHDPQPEGVQGESFSTTELLRGYERANAWAARTHASLPEGFVGLDGLPVSVPAPRAVIARAWEWNDAVPARQERRGVTFVANALHGWQDGRLFTFAVWGDAMSILLPEVDFVVIARDQLAVQRGRIEHAVVPWSDLPGGSVSSDDVDAPHVEYRHAEPPAELEPDPRSAPALRALGTHPEASTRARKYPAFPSASGCPLARTQTTNHSTPILDQALVRWFGALAATGIPFRRLPFERLIDTEYLN